MNGEINHKIVLGIIPARGGSKGIPGKNIKEVNGKPLIGYAIECGLKCPSIDHLIVTTDSKEIAAVAIKYGAEVPFLRPNELASDETPMLPVLQHAISTCEQLYKKQIDFIVLLDPTGPLRAVEDVEGCIAFYKSKQCDAIISVNKAHRYPDFNMVKFQEGCVKLVIDPVKKIGRRQDCEQVYDMNTVVWIYSRRAIMDEQKRIPERTLMYIVPNERAIDIDTELDFRMLAFLMEDIKSNGDKK
jgi:CMP-N,N'-diacetyllegionaminic acid synthase